MEHLFTPTIMEILREDFGDLAQDIFNSSMIVNYLNIKTKSVNQGSKSRGAFANHYALYVLMEDYIDRGFDEKGDYKNYPGARFSDLLTRMKALPFGSKLQNHALNSRLNDEFTKYFPTTELRPILRDPNTNHYWLNENLILVSLASGKQVNLAKSIVRIIDAYVDAKRNAFDTFFAKCQKMQTVQAESPAEVKAFIAGLIAPTSDARLFEVVSFSILKAFYGDHSIYWGWKRDDLREEALILYKTGRTNANDGGIDFVMRPLGRFFQVTETVDVNKYFLDIDKVQKFPLTFIIKSDDDTGTLLKRIRAQAQLKYPVAAIIEKYMGCIEEIINIRMLVERFDEAVARGFLNQIMDEIVVQSRVEFNYEDDDEDADDEDEAIRETLPEDARYVVAHNPPIRTASTPTLSLDEREEYDAG